MHGTREQVATCSAIPLRRHPCQRCAPRFGCQSSFGQIQPAGNSAPQPRAPGRPPVARKQPFGPVRPWPRRRRARGGGRARAVQQTVVQEVLEAEMTETLQAEKNERTMNRLGHRSGYYDRKLVTRVGVLELRVPQDRTGRFSTELFERYQRSEKALVAALAEMYVQGVSTRKVKAITEELCGHSFSASAISDATARLDGMLTAFAERRLSEAYPYLILDARYERIRDAGAVQSQAVLVAIGVDWEGRRQVLGIELANRESRSSWRDFLTGLKARGLFGVEFVVSDNHEGLKAAIRETLPEAGWQRCYVHFLPNALDYVPRKVDDDYLIDMRWFYDRRDLAELRRHLVAWLAKSQAPDPDPPA